MRFVVFVPGLMNTILQSSATNVELPSYVAFAHGHVSDFRFQKDTLNNLPSSGTIYPNGLRLEYFNNFNSECLKIAKTMNVQYGVYLYDWRLPWDELADQLSQYLLNLPTGGVGDEICLVGFSMGSPICRLAQAKTPRVSRVVSLAGAYLGAISTAAYLGGSSPTLGTINWINALVSNSPPGYSASNRETTEQLAITLGRWPSIYCLLPRYGTKQWGGEPFKSNFQLLDQPASNWNYPDAFSDFWAARAKSIHLLLNQIDSDKTKVPSSGLISVVALSKTDQTLDEVVADKKIGAPHTIRATNFGNGDGTVPTENQIMPWSETVLVESAHSSLPNKLAKADQVAPLVWDFWKPLTPPATPADTTPQAISLPAPSREIGESPIPQAYPGHPSFSETTRDVQTRYTGSGTRAKKRKTIKLRKATERLVLK